MRTTNFGPCPYCPDGIVTDPDAGMCNRCDSVEKLDDDPGIEGEIERARYEYEFALGVWPEPDTTDIPF